MHDVRQIAQDTIKPRKVLNCTQCLQENAATTSLKFSKLPQVKLIVIKT